MTKELEKLQKERKKARYAGYFAVLLIMIVLTDILDNLATNVGANITSSFITEFFVNGKVFVLRHYVGIGNCLWTWLFAFLHVGEHLPSFTSPHVICYPCFSCMCRWVDKRAGA